MKKFKLAAIALGGASIGLVACGTESLPPEDMAKRAGAFTDVIAAIVDGTAEGSLTMEEAVDLAHNAGLVVTGSPEDGDALLEFVDPGTGEVLLKMSSVSQLRSSLQVATDLGVNGKADTSGAVSCLYKDVRYVFDQIGDLYGLPPREGGYRLLVDPAVPHGERATERGCGTWNEALPGTFRTPEPKGGAFQSLYLSAFSDGYVIVRCMTAKEVAALKNPSTLADTSVDVFDGAATGVVRVQCGQPDLALEDALATVMQHECGHALGIAHSATWSILQPSVMKPSLNGAALAAGPIALSAAMKASLKSAWDPASTDRGTDCFKGYNSKVEADPCEGDACCGSSDPCCGSADPCCGSDDPCCGSGDPYCGDPCGGDSCCGDPACECYGSGDNIFVNEGCHACSDVCNYCNFVLLGDCETWIMDWCDCTS